LRLELAEIRLILFSQSPFGQVYFVRGPFCGAPEENDYYSV